MPLPDTRLLRIPKSREVNCCLARLSACDTRAFLASEVPTSSLSLDLASFVKAVRALFARVFAVLIPASAPARATADARDLAFLATPLTSPRARSATRLLTFSGENCSFAVDITASLAAVAVSRIAFLPAATATFLIFGANLPTRDPKTAAADFHALNSGNFASPARHMRFPMKDTWTIFRRTIPRLIIGIIILPSILYMENKPYGNSF